MCFFSIPVSNVSPGPLVAEATLLQAPRWVPTKSYNLGCLDILEHIFWRMNCRSPIHGDVTPEIPHGDVDITSPGVIRIDHEPKMNRSSARVSFEEYLKKGGMGFVVLCCFHFSLFVGLEGHGAVSMVKKLECLSFRRSKVDQ